MSNAVVLFSGGQDSTTVLAHAISKHKKVLAVSFDYGQRHAVELECAKRIAEQLKVEHLIVSVPSLYWDKSALLDKRKKITMTEKGVPSSFVPNRNLLFLTIAHTIAMENNCSVIYFGANVVDYSGYPDCRGVFIKSAQRTLNLSSNSKIKIKTPILLMNKAKIWELAHKLNVLQLVVEQTHTCYNGVHNELHYWGYGCGKCPACELRKKGYREFNRRNK